MSDVSINIIKLIKYYNNMNGWPSRDDKMESEWLLITI